MTNTIGRVNFTAVLDGKGMDRDAEAVGRKAGAAGAAGYDKTWTKGFEDTLTKTGRMAYENWKKNGDESGRIYSTAMSERVTKMLREANRNFEGLRLDAGFLDDWNRSFDDAGLAAGELQKQIKLLEDAGEGNASAFRAARRQIDEWAESQRQAAIETNRLADAQDDAAVRRRHAMNGLLVDLATESAAYRDAQNAVQAAADAEAQLATDQARHTEARDNLINVIREHNDSIAETNREYQSNIRLSDAILARSEKMIQAHKDHSFAWKDLSHNTRQWTLIIGAVMAGMQEIAVLGSAAGAGLIALGGAATSGIIGIGGLAAVFVTLNKDLEELPQNLRPVAVEFDRFKDVFGELRETIAGGAFSQMDGVFDGLSRTTRALTPEMQQLGFEVGKLFRQFEQNTRPGTEAFEQIRKSVELAGPNFASLAQSSGTFGEGLLRAFNRAQPLVEDLLGYVDRLANQFNSFSRSNGFTEWIERSQATWESFGGLLDAVGRGLNDLVTAESAARTQGFLENLTEFIPNLTKFLDILGRLDIFGLVAEGLNAFGQAMEPLAGPTAEFAEAMNALVVDVLEAFVPIASDVAAILGPLVSGLAGLISVLPDAGAGEGLMLLAGAFVAFKAAAGISAAVTAVGVLQTNLAGMGALGATAATGLGRVTSAVGKFAGIGAGAVIGIGLLANAITNLTDSAAKAPPGIERIRNSLEKGDLNGAFSNASASADSFSESLRMLTGDDLKSQIERFGQGLGEGLGVTGSLKEARDGVSSLDAALAQMVGSGQGEQAAELFERIKTAAMEQGVSMEELTQLFPAYDDASLAAADATREVGDSMLLVREAAAASEEQIDSLSDAIKGFAETNFGARDAARDYEAAIDDLTASIEENGTTLDITTEAGRANQEAVDELAQSVLNHTAETLRNTGSVEQATGVMAAGRDELIRTMRQFGYTKEQAEAYADELGLIPKNVQTQAQLTGVAQAEAQMRELTRQRTVYINAVLNRATLPDLNGAVSGSGRPGLASGRILTGAMDITAGEAGPEAIVPLNRPLSQVDPSVRWLSAIAQGLAPQPMAAGGIAGGGTTLNFEAGSVVAYEAYDAGAVANEFLRQIFERVNG